VKVETSRKKRLEAKRPVNRKLLLAVFVITGLASGFFWWRGKVIHETVIPAEGVAVKIETEPTRKVNKKQDKLVADIESLVATASGRYAVSVYHLGDNSGYGINQNERMPAASLMKLPVMTAVSQMIAGGQLELDDTYTLEGADRATGSGPLQFKTAGSVYTIDELLSYLGKNSDNTAWVMFNRRLGKKTMESELERLGMKDSSYDELVTTAADTVRMFEYIYKQEGELFEYLTDSIYEDRIPVGLTGAEGVRVIHKVGTDVGVWADAGIVSCQLTVENCRLRPFILAILNENVKREEAQTIVPQIAKLVWEYEKTL